MSQVFSQCEAARVVPRTMPARFNRNTESDNGCPVPCKKPHFSVSENDLKTGLFWRLTALFSHVAGIMSTCRGAYAGVVLTAVCAGENFGEAIRLAMDALRWVGCAGCKPFP